jgi:nucleotide-binding universal stress UspA family protein
MYAFCKEEGKTMNIMICHDGSRNAQDALDRTVKMFWPLTPQIILMTVVEVPLDASIDSDVIFQRWRDERHAFLLRTAEDLTAQGFEVDVVLAVGDPREMILEAAKNKKPDIVVIGKRGGGKVGNMALGSTSAYLIRHIRCPVLIFHKQED